MKNLVKIATYYIGYYLAMKGEFSIHWYSRAAFATAFPDQAPPDEPWSEVMVLIDGYMHAPMGTVLDVLANGASAMSVYQYVSIKLERLTPAPPLDENENCQRFMRATQSGATQGVDVRYLDRIRDIQPDYSLRSIERLNILLGKIRSEDPLDFNAFMHSEGHFNFLLWCSFYLGSTISRIARTQMKWLSYEQAKQADPGLEREIVTHHVCLINGRVYFPLAMVTQNLFAPKVNHINLAEHLKEVIAKQTNPLRQMHIPQQCPEKGAFKDDTTLLACYEAGRFGATALSLASIVGNDSTPLLFSPETTDRQGQFQDFSFYESTQEAYQVVEDRLNTNPDNLPYLIASTDSFGNFATGRKDALTIRLKIFPPRKFLIKPLPLEFVVMLPYQKPGEAEPYCTFAPVLQLSELPSGQATDQAMAAFVAGLVSFMTVEFIWRKFYTLQSLLQ